MMENKIQATIQMSYVILAQLNWIVYDKKCQPMAEEIRTWNKTH